jgi:hypothetical protein
MLIRKLHFFCALIAFSLILHWRRCPLTKASQTASRPAIRKRREFRENTAQQTVSRLTTPRALCAKDKRSRSLLPYVHPVLWHLQCRGWYTAIVHYQSAQKNTATVHSIMKKSARLCLFMLCFCFTRKKYKNRWKKRETFRALASSIVKVVEHNFFLLSSSCFGFFVCAR